MSHLPSPLELVAPDCNANDWDAYFRQNGEQVFPHVGFISSFGAEINLNGVTYTASASEVAGFPGPGIYTFQPVESE